jgi:hypothetical protein
MAQTAKPNLTGPQPTPCPRLPRSKPRHESPASPPKTRPLHEREGASHENIHEAQLHLASTAVTDQVHDPRYRHEKRTISRGKAGGKKPQSLALCPTSALRRANRISEPRNDPDGSDELQQPAPLAGPCRILPATRKSRPALPLLSRRSTELAGDTGSAAQPGIAAARPEPDDVRATDELRQRPSSRRRDDRFARRSGWR